MYRIIAGYVGTLPGAVEEGMRLFSTHCLRATTATLILDSGVDIRKFRNPLPPPGYHHQLYDKDTKESASHDVPI